MRKIALLSILMLAAAPAAAQQAVAPATSPAPTPAVASPAALPALAPPAAMVMDTAPTIVPAPVQQAAPTAAPAAVKPKPAPAKVSTVKPGGALKDLPEVKTVQDYLQNLKTLKARFIQTANDGTQLAGDFMLKRPGRMRFEYDYPVKDFIVADGLMIYYYDGEMKEQRNTLISQSLADFFLRENVRFSGDVSVSDVKRADGLLQITLIQTKDPRAGSLVLGITEKPEMELKKWRVVDAQGMTTEVELFDATSGISLDNSKFHYYDPEHTKERFN